MGIQLAQSELLERQKTLRFNYIYTNKLHLKLAKWFYLHIKLRIKLQKNIRYNKFKFKTVLKVLF